MLETHTVIPTCIQFKEHPMSEMKVIMENWNKFHKCKPITEAYLRNCREQFANAGQFADAYRAAMAVASKDKNAKELLDKLQTGAEWATAFGGVLVAAGVATAGVSAALGGSIAAFAGLGNLIIGAIRSGRNKKFDKRVMDTIFNALCIDPAVLDVTDDELEEVILATVEPFNDMETFLSGLKPTAPVPDLNSMFIQAINDKLRDTDQSELTDKS